MEIQHKRDEEKGAVFIDRDGEVIAEIIYSITSPEEIVIEHTEVLQDFRGQGLGYKLLEFLVIFMRENNLKATPLCPFAKAAFKKNKEYWDTLI